MLKLSRRAAYSAAALCAAAALTLWALGDGVPAQAASAPSYITDAVNAPGRPPTDRLRDAVLKPAEVLAWSGLKPGDSVVDLNPGNGYWTRLLSKVVGPKGRVYSLVQRPGAPTGMGGNAQPIGTPPPAGGGGGGAPPGAGGPPPVINDANGGARGDDVVQSLAIMNTRDYANVTSLIEGAQQFFLPEQADYVWAADYHTLHEKKYGAPGYVLAFTQSIFRAMNSGGHLIVIDNLGASGTAFNQTETLHRIEKDYLRSEILPAQFLTEADSNLLADASDDHTKPVADNSGDKADRLLMKFVKPLDASNAVAAHNPDRMKNYWGKSYVLGGGAVGTGGGVIWFNQDRTYIEIGPKNPNSGQFRVQRGSWFFDADGNGCILFQYPLQSRQNVSCHPFIPEIVANGRWIEFNGGRGGPYVLTPGHDFPLVPPTAAAAPAGNQGG